MVDCHRQCTILSSDSDNNRLPSVHIQGDGVAGRCCGFLLERTGRAVSLQAKERARVPAILLNASAVALICDVFGNRELLNAAKPVRKRVVAWARGATPAALPYVELPHAAIVVSEELLLACLPRVSGQAMGDQAAELIYAAPPFPQHVTVERFGSRMASSCSVTLRAATAEAACWMEATRDGWLFLVQDAPASGWLLSVGASAETLLGQSSLVEKQIDRCGPASGEFAAHPRIAAPLAGRGWLLCGTAAMGFDPICGDGTAYAVREGILAAAVVSAMAAGGDEAALLRHYTARSIAGFGRHLALCREFYRSGFGGPWWDEELAGIERGIAWCRAAVLAEEPFCYRLNGFTLERVA